MLLEVMYSSQFSRKCRWCGYTAQGEAIPKSKACQVTFSAVNCSSRY